jgi:hypothetical protein
MQRVRLRPLLWKLVFWVMNPRVLGTVILLPSMFFLLRAGNEVIANPELFVAGHWPTAEIMLLSFTGAALGITIFVAPYPKRRASGRLW